MIRNQIHYAEQPALFEPGSIDHFPRTPIRPLGAVSNYVVEDLPGEINRLGQSGYDIGHVASLAEKIGRMVGPMSEERLLGLREQDMAVARTDIIYLYNALIQLGTKQGVTGDKLHSFVPSELLRLVKVSASITSAPPFLTYADLVLFNPVTSDPRVSSTGVTGHVEKDFYNGHRYIECELGKAIEFLVQGIKSSDPMDAITSLNAATSNLRSCVHVMMLFRDKMSREDFGAFRGFFGKNSFYQTLGPSGRFSAKVPHITALLVGDRYERVRPDFFHFLFANKSLYPSDDFYYMAKTVCSSFYPALDADIDGHRARRGIVPISETKGGQPATMSQVVDRNRGCQLLADAFIGCVKMLDIFTGIHVTAAKEITVTSGKEIQGVETGESPEKVLAQRSGLLVQCGLKEFLKPAI